MATQTKENYLKALYYLHQKDAAISITNLGKEMEVSKPTVNDMVKKLQVMGWVKYEKYKPLYLTKQGLKQASNIIRKHRLSELFLSNIMGFGWEEVHAIAEDMEHLKSESFFDRVDELLGYPKNDPHGSPIPDKNGKIESITYIPLAKVQAGKKVVLKALRDSSAEFIKYLNRKEIKLGAVLKVDQIEPFDNSRIVSYKKHSKELLSYAVCNQLLVVEE